MPSERSMRLVRQPILRRNRPERESQNLPKPGRWMHMQLIRLFVGATLVAAHPLCAATVHDFNDDTGVLLNAIAKERHEVGEYYAMGITVICDDTVFNADGGIESRHTLTYITKANDHIMELANRDDNGTRKTV